ncbi:MAG: PhoH family protein [Candidatus Nealsonbacteria bacterium]|nr:PhoH family protein [Candidatus Nealsonbacteria bacterium]
MTTAASEVDQCVKGYVVDASVLLHDPDAVSNLAKDPENFVVIPLCVLEELDRAKRDSGEKGFNARQVARMLDDLRRDGQESLKSGVRIGKDKGIILVDHDGDGIKQLSPELEDSNDNRILVIAKKWQDAKPDRPIAIVTKDINMRLKADAVGILANDYRQDKAVRDITQLYSGWMTIQVGDPSILTDLGPGRELQADRLAEFTDLSSLFPNQCCEIHCGSKYQLAVFKKRAGIFRYVAKPQKSDVEWKNERVKPKNDGQALLAHLLRDPSIPLITVKGRAGTGKSLITFAMGYKQLSKAYRFLLIYKPIIEVGEKTLGLLPGDLQEKMEPWEAAVYDSFNLILGHDGENNGQENHSARTIIQDFLETGMMEISPISYIRGRSLNNAFIVVDEAQNLTPHEVKTLITRVGKDSKIVLAGDVEQIDNTYVDATSNGLSRAVELLKNHELAAHITLTQGERSELAELAACLM